MSSPKPGPSAESLETARELHEKLDDRHGHGYYCEPETCAWCISVALALDAALQRGEKKGLQRAAEVAEGIAVKNHLPGPTHSLNIVSKAAEAAALDVERAIRALMEAE